MKKKAGRNNPQKPVHSKNIARSSSFENIIDKYGNWITIGLIAILVTIVFKDYLFGNLYYLFYDFASDSMDIGYPAMVHVSNYIHTEGFPLWSFAEGMGQNIMSGSLSDPFCWIVYLSGSNNIAAAIIWMEVSKIFVTAFFFSRFLRQWKFSAIPVIIGTILYSFSGFIIIGNAWWGFSTEACFLAFLLLGFEKLYNNNEWYLFPLAIAFIAMHSPFELYTSGTFLVIYLLFRHFSSDDHSFRKLIRISIKMAGLGVLGLGIGSMLFISNCLKMIESPRVSGNFSLSHSLSSIPVFAFERMEHYVTLILRFFSNDLIGNENTFSGWHNYLEAPLFYIGLLPLLILPQLFLYLERRRRFVFGLFLILLIIPVIFPYFRYALFLFSGDYYRSYSLFISLTILLFSLYALNESATKKAFNPFLLICTLAVLFILIYLPYSTRISNLNIDGSPFSFAQNNSGKLSIDTEIRSVITIFLLLYTTIIFLLS
ncbi:MAG: YfhO family protein, partial [Bacteroidetes bacterium]|nr:YfhO family protein [Bacteroidota bacterium]